MPKPVYVLGGYQSDFARNLGREGRGLAELVLELVPAALEDAGVTADQVESIHFGNAFGELFTGQAQLGAMPASVIPELWGVPAMRHEGACASGSLAVLAAMAEIEAERYDCVLVVGAEIERNLSGDLAAKHLGAAAWVGKEATEARYPWPHLFSRLTAEVDARFGLQSAHLGAIAKKNFDNARKNPKAQARAWKFSERSFTEDDELNPIVEGRVRRQDCGQVTDGGAAVLLTSARFVEERWRGRRPAAPVARIAGFGHRTAGLDLATKLARSHGSLYLLPDLRRAIEDAYARAKLSGPSDLSGIETHDCFTITEYVAIDHFGITPPGESFRAIESGSIFSGGKLPINPSGGLIGNGHPVGATGVRMLFDAARQVTGRAEETQVEGAKRFATLNIGGSTTTSVCFIVERENA